MLKPKKEGHSYKINCNTGDVIVPVIIILIFLFSSIRYAKSILLYGGLFSLVYGILALVFINYYWILLFFPASKLKFNLKLVFGIFYLVFGLTCLIIYLFI